MDWTVDIEPRAIDSPAWKNALSAPWLGWTRNGSPPALPSFLPDASRLAPSPPPPPAPYCDCIGRDPLQALAASPRRNSQVCARIHKLLPLAALPDVQMSAPGSSAVLCPNMHRDLALPQLPSTDPRPVPRRNECRTSIVRTRQVSHLPAFA